MHVMNLQHQILNWRIAAHTEAYTIRQCQFGSISGPSVNDLRAIYYMNIWIFKFILLKIFITNTWDPSPHGLAVVLKSLDDSLFCISPQFLQKCYVRSKICFILDIFWIFWKLFICNCVYTEEFLTFEKKSSM